MLDSCEAGELGPLVKARIIQVLHATQSGCLLSAKAGKPGKCV